MIRQGIESFIITIYANKLNLPFLLFFHLAFDVGNKNYLYLIQLMNIRQLPNTMLGQNEDPRRQQQIEASRGPVNYEQKYKKALKSIEDIIKANKQIKEELDALRTMRQVQIDSLTLIQREQFKKAFDAILKEKNTLVITLQSLELENQKLKCTITELQNQVSIYKAEKFTRIYENRESFEPSQTPELGITTAQHSPRPEGRDVSQLLRDKEAEFHKTLQNYEEHHSNLARTNKRLQERLGELENKLINTEKNYKNKLENKELEVIDIKALTRQEFTDQIAALRKENSTLKISNNDLLIRIESMEKNSPLVPSQKFDWEADLIQQMIAIKSNLEPLRQQISQLQELNVYEKQQSIREKTNLRTQVLELQAEVERQNETVKTLERKVIDNHQEKIVLEDKSSMMRKLEEENQLLQGKVIVMESREVALRNRTGQELEERVLEFENRVELLLSNKEGLKELKEVNIHQLLALKAYVMELDSKIRQLLNSNSYLTRKYKSYKQKYQSSLKEHKHYEMTINSLKMKILGYDKLVLKLQEELEFTVRSHELEIIQITSASKPSDENSELYKKKYELMKEKLQIQEKYKLQQFQTLKLGYETRIMELTIQVEEIRSLKETLELYRSKNQELQMVVTKRDNQLYQSKRLSSLRTSNVEEHQSTTRQTKDIINSLHVTIKHSDQNIFKLQTELRTKEENYKRTITKLEREISDLKEDQSRDASKKEIEKTLQYEQEVKKYKLKINDLEHELHLLQANHKDQYNKKTDDFDFKLRQLETRVQEAEEQREEEIFSKRRLEKQNLGLTLDKQELQANIQELESRISQLKRENDDLRAQPITSASFTSFKQEYNGSMDFELQSKDNIIRKLNNEISQLRGTVGEYGEKDITIGSLKNQIFYLKKEIEDLNDVINKYTNEISFLKGHLDSSKSNFNSGLEAMLEEKDNLLMKARKETSNKEFKIRELEDEISRLEETIRKMRKDLNEIEYFKQQNESLQRTIGEKSSFAERLKYQSTGYEQDVDRYKREIAYLKENMQKLNYDLLERDDQISKLNLQLSTASLKGKEQIDSRLSQELQNKERQYNKLNSDFLTLKSTMTLLEEDKNYHEENYKRANAELMNIRSQYNLLQDENSSFSEQLYRKNQELSKLQFSLQTLEGQVNDYGQKDEELYKIRNEMFAMRTGNSALEDQLYNKEASLSRALKELNYMKDQYGQLQEDIKIKQETINRLNFDLNNIRRNHDESSESLQEKDVIINRLNLDLTNSKNKYNELEEEMEEREQQIMSLTQQMNQLKVDSTYYQDDAEQKISQITRLTNQRQILRSQIVRLNEDITEKNMQINRFKQEVFGIRMEVSQNQYEKQLKSEQEIMMFKNRINLLEHQLEDRDIELRRLSIELETSRYKPGSAIPQITEEDMQQMRNEINKKQRELIAIKFDLDDKQFQLQSTQSTLALLKNTVNELQMKIENDHEDFERTLREVSLRQRKANEEANLLREDLEMLQAKSQVEKPKSFAITYSEEEMNDIQERLAQKQFEMVSLRNQLQEREFYIESVHSKVQMQDNLIKQLQAQAHEDLARAEGEIQEFIKRERSFREAISQLELSHQDHLLEVQKNQRTTITQHFQEQNYDMQEVLKVHIEEIDRLNMIVKSLEEEISDFKLKLSSMVNQENRIDENLVTMVLLFTEIEALRDRMKIKETEINEVRKSFIQMTVAGEIESNKMSRILSLTKQEQESHDRLDYESKSDVSVPMEGENALVQDFRRKQYNAAPLEDKGFRREENNYFVHQETYIPSQTVQVQQGMIQEGERYVGEQNQQYQQYQIEQVQPEAYFIQNQFEQANFEAQAEPQQAIEAPRNERQEIVEVQNQPVPAPPKEVRSEPPAPTPQPENVPEPEMERRNDFSGSLINELQKEPQRQVNESQNRAGQIIIKIPSNSQVSLTRSLASEPQKMVQGYVQAGPGQMQMAGPYNMVQVQRHSQHVVHQQMGVQQLPFHSQGMVPQPQIVRVSPGRVIAPPPYRPSQY